MRVMGPIVTAEELRQVIHYDPDTGLFTWIKCPRSSILPGSPAASLGKAGYMNLQVNKRLYKAHRLAWLYMTGEWPKDTVDHINRVKSDNRWENLREATALQQIANRVCLRNSKAGLKGVSYAKDKYGAKKYRAIYYRGGRRQHLGYFLTAQEAHEAYCKRAAEMDGEYAVNAGVPSRL